MVLAAILTNEDSYVLIGSLVNSIDTCKVSRESSPHSSYLHGVSIISAVSAYSPMILKA